MGRIACVPNKVTTEVKGLLQDIIDGVLCSIEVQELEYKSKIKAVTNITSVYITTIKKYYR